MLHGQARKPSLTRVARQYLSIPTLGNPKLSLPHLLLTGARSKHPLWVGFQADGVLRTQRLELKETIGRRRPHVHGSTRLLADRPLAMATFQTGILPPRAETVRRKIGNLQQGQTLRNQLARRLLAPGDRLQKTSGRTMIHRSHVCDRSRRKCRQSQVQTHPGGVALGPPVTPQQSSRMMGGEIH